MVSKRRVERDIRTLTRTCFKHINTHKEYAYLIALCIFSGLVFMDPTFEKILIYIIGLIGVQMVVITDRKRKLNKNK